MELTVRLAYLAYLAVSATAVYNLAAVSALLGVSGGGGGSFLGWIFAVIYFLVTPMFAWCLWYRRLYSAAKNGSSLAYITFFVFFFVNTCFTLIGAVAPPFGGGTIWGLTGWISAVRLMTRTSMDMDNFEGQTAVAVFYAIGASIFSLLSLYNVYMFRATIQGFKQARLSMAQARQEMKNSSSTTKEQGKGSSAAGARV